MPETMLSPAQLWKRMTNAQRVAAAHALWSDEEAADDQMQAALIIAQRKKFRPKTVNGLDVERKARHLASLVPLPEPLAGRLLILYHLTEQRPMMAAFLDALGIAHEDGLIKDDDVKPDATKLAPAVALIGEKFPPEDVGLYLQTLACQDPETWGGLSELAKKYLEP